jgi:hypothetical protein
MKFINYINNQKEKCGRLGKGDDDVAIKCKLHKCEVFLKNKKYQHQLEHISHNKCS